MTGSENSSFTIYGELFQSNNIPSKTHTADLNSTVALDMIWVEPGTFTMGSPTTETGRGTDETEHNVTLTEGFYLGKYEVTQAQYEAVMTGNSYGLSAKPSWFDGHPNRPVENVSWDDIQKFLIRLNTLEADNIPEGWAYVLPTEAQWEYACRAGTTSAYSWGDTITTSNANYNASGNYTVDVGQYSANPWGFYDMHGNVSELTLDTLGSYSADPKTDPYNAGSSGSWRVDRGRSWYDNSSDLRSASRGSVAASDSNYHLGFRVGFQQQ